MTQEEKNEDLKTMTIQLPMWIVEELDRLAEIERRSRQNLILVICEEYIEQKKLDNPEIH